MFDPIKLLLTALNSDLLLFVVKKHYWCALLGAPFKIKGYTHTNSLPTQDLQAHQLEGEDSLGLCLYHRSIRPITNVGFVLISLQPVTAAAQPLKIGQEEESSVPVQVTPGLLRLKDDHARRDHVIHNFGPAVSATVAHRVLAYSHRAESLPTV